MVVLIVGLLFVAFVVVDNWEERRRARELLADGENLHRVLEKTEPEWVGGFKLFPSLSYHRNHTWVHWVTPEQAYVGLDDFARRLLGRDAVVQALPVGTQVSQGEEAIEARREDARVGLLSPITGEVTAVNPHLKEDPDLVFRDNYTQGWIYKVKSPRLFKEFSNLLNGSLARRWMEDTRDRFQQRLVAATGNVIQDGGASIEDIASGLKQEEWRTLVSEFLSPKSMGS